MFNNSFLFPFEKIEKNAKVVVCGAGKVGKSFVNQIQKSSYCDLVLWTDQNYQNKRNDIFTVSPHEAVSKEEFDYAVIGVSSPNLEKEIRRTLLDYRVPNEKIIYVRDRRLTNVQVEPSLKEFCFSEKYKRDAIIDYFLRDPQRDLDIFWNLIIQISKYENSEEIQNVLMNIFYEEKNQQRAYVILRILLMCRLMNPEMMEKYVHFTENIENPKHRYWMLVDMGILEFFHQEWIYDDYYLDRRRVMKKTAHELLDKNMAFKHSSGTGISRIAILTTNMNHVDESVTRFVMDYANEIAGHNVEVAIFITEPFLYFYGEAFIVPMASAQPNSNSFRQEHKEILAPQIKIYYDAGGSLHYRFNKCLENISNFCPDAVLDCSGKHSYISSVLVEHYPVICISTGHCCTTASFDKYICRDKTQCVEWNEKYHSINEKDMVELPKGSIIPDPKLSYNRRDEGFKEDDFIIVTVGSRLNNEMSKEFIDIVCDALCSIPHAKWVIVGSWILYIENEYKEMLDSGKVIFRGHEEDLPAFYRLCDIYLNPNRFGGGGSVIWALAAGIPVAATDYPGDANHWIGRDYLIHGDYTALMAYVRKLYENSDYRREVGLKMKQNVKGSSFSDKVDKLLVLCNELKGKKTKGVL
mgnify:CR=1 FL=1